MNINRTLKNTFKSVIDYSMIVRKVAKVRKPQFAKYVHRKKQQLMKTINFIALLFLKMTFKGNNLDGGPNNSRELCPFCFFELTNMLVAAPPCVMFSSE